jgi:oxygen-independent coproporphyrinogen-3 oxidase
MTETAGVYISVPFCRAKCTYCNFASGVFGSERMDAYIDRVCTEIKGARGRAAGMAAELPSMVDSVYLGGGTPSLLEPAQVARLFAALRAEFCVEDTAEITLECAPGQLSDDTLQEMLRARVSRVSFGVQSFVDSEARAVGRFHTREVCLAEIARLRYAGLENISVDLIAGLPGQSAASWRESVEMAIESGVPHVSVYMLEVDEDSRLGRELLEAGARYGAAAVPEEDAIAEWYLAGCEWLEAAGIRQYEISNFARAGSGSRHNVKYWNREPYIGFGLDAHSMLRSGEGVVRFANTSDLDAYLEGPRQGSGDHAFPLLMVAPEVDRLGRERQFEEALFLGLRMNEGVSVSALRAEFGGLVESLQGSLEDVIEAGLLVREGDSLRLTALGRMASNEVFSRILVVAT